LLLVLVLVLLRALRDDYEQASVKTRFFVEELIARVKEEEMRWDEDEDGVKKQ
jgi:hypothetical protein